MSTIGQVHYRCWNCGHQHAVDERVWRCGACGGVLDLAGFGPDLPTLPLGPQRGQGMWRYVGALPPMADEALSMGEGQTPLVGIPGHAGIALKLDYLMPTGSFKDRGAVLLASLGRYLKARRVLTDSSGNAGAALAAYAARAEIACDVYVPQATSPSKVGQLEAYGATVHRVPGTRADTAQAAAEAADAPGALYASHVFNPLFHHGTKTYVLEVWEALGGSLPRTLVLPVGNGTLVLGAYLACTELMAQGLIGAYPRIVGVQASACAPLAAELMSRSARPGLFTALPTIAEGIAIVDPPRRQQIVAAIRATGGCITVVTEDQVRRAHYALARLGFYVEPTSAVCFAAYLARSIDGGGRTTPNGLDVVIPLCGSGLKSKPPS